MIPAQVTPMAFGSAFFVAPAALRPMVSPARPTHPYSTCARSVGLPVAPAVSQNKGVRMEVTIVVGDGEPIDSALRRFKKEVLKSGHLFELRRRRYFETNTEKRLRKAAASRRKARIQRQINEKGRMQRQQQRLSRAATLTDASTPGTLGATSPIADIAERPTPPIRGFSGDS